MMALDGARQVKGVFEVFRGTLTSAPVHAREVFAPAMLCGAATVIVAHNHPSGKLDVSDADKRITAELRAAGDLLNINLDDHLIIANGTFVSV